jgi:hypothetical protein
VDVRRSILLAVFLAGVCAVLSGALWQIQGSSGGPADAAPAAERPSAEAAARPNAETEAVAVLRAWDDRRARAWGEGDLAGLARLYTPGSRTAAIDGAMLRSYLRRGLVVEGMHTQVLAAGVRFSDETHLTLLVTDRLAAATAVGGGTRLALPRDRATNHTVELVKQGGTWLVREVR